MVTTTNIMTAGLCSVSGSRLVTSTWQTPNVAIAVPATHLVEGMAVGYVNGEFAAQAVAADKHSRQAKPAAPPRGFR